MGDFVMKPGSQYIFFDVGRVLVQIPVVWNKPGGDTMISDLSTSDLSFCLHCNIVPSCYSSLGGDLVDNLTRGSQLDSRFTSRDSLLFGHKFVFLG